MPTIPRKTAPTLRDVLSHLTFAQAARLLGPDGKHMLSAESARYQTEFDLDAAVRITDQTFKLDLYDAAVTLSLSPEHKNRLACCCSACHGDNPACEHVAFALSVVLEEKTALGLAKPPPERVPVASLSEQDLIKRALAERGERARAERMRVQPAKPDQVWGEYMVTNPASGKAYRVSLRGWERGESFCSGVRFPRRNIAGRRRWSGCIQRVWRPVPRCPCRVYGNRRQGPTPPDRHPAGRFSPRAFVDDIGPGDVYKTINRGSSTGNGIFAQ